MSYLGPLFGKMAHMMNCDRRRILFNLCLGKESSIFKTLQSSRCTPKEFSQGNPRRTPKSQDKDVPFSDSCNSRSGKHVRE